MKKVYIIHGWEGGTYEKQLLWLKDKLIATGFEVVFKDMPNADTPRIDVWVEYMNKIIELDENTYLIGHSIGCQAIMHYLEQAPTDVKLGGVLFIAGWFTLTGLETKEEYDLAKPWLNTPIDFSKVKQHTNRITAIFSDDDPFVPIENVDLFKERLGANTLILHNKGHFSSKTVHELPEVFSELIKMANV